MVERARPKTWGGLRKGDVVWVRNGHGTEPFPITVTARRSLTKTDPPLQPIDFGSVTFEALPDSELIYPDDAPSTYTVDTTSTGP